LCARHVGDGVATERDFGDFEHNQSGMLNFYCRETQLFSESDLRSNGNSEFNQGCAGVSPAASGDPPDARQFLHRKSKKCQLIFL
jgi:hypothetical protein